MTAFVTCLKTSISISTTSIRLPIGRIYPSALVVLSARQTHLLSPRNLVDQTDPFFPFRWRAASPHIQSAAGKGRCAHHKRQSIRPHHCYNSLTICSFSSVVRFTLRSQLISSPRNCVEYLSFLQCLHRLYLDSISLPASHSSFISANCLTRRHGSNAFYTIGHHLFYTMDPSEELPV
jgi:hypothetical protein